MNAARARAAGKPTPVRGAGDDKLTALDAEDKRRNRIAKLAYEMAEARGFTPGGEVDDWLQAERRLMREA